MTSEQLDIYLRTYYLGSITMYRGNRYNWRVDNDVLLIQIMPVSGDLSYGVFKLTSNLFSLNGIKFRATLEEAENMIHAHILATNGRVLTIYSKDNEASL